jgi:hypothetical protein
MAQLPRGVRNANPGNIDRTGTKWQGMAADQSGDPRFIVFDAPEWGIRAIVRVLRTYYDKHGLRTVKGIINRWAPPVENDTEAYYVTVAKKLGADPGEQIDIDDLDTLRTLVKAIIRHENGRGPEPDGGWYSDDVIDEGIRRAA